MRTSSRFASMACGAIAAATLAACGSAPMSSPSASASPTYSSGSYPATSQAAMEYGRVTNIEAVPATSAGTRRPNVIGAVVGGLAGAVLGSQVGSGSGRDAATVLGGVAGAAAGSQVGRSQTPPVSSTSGAYLITVQTDNGGSRTYEVGATGDLRVGDRVRVENGVIYRA